MVVLSSIGVLLSFAASVYASCIGSTRKIAQYPKELVGLAGICFGFGEVFGK